MRIVLFVLLFQLCPGAFAEEDAVITLGEEGSLLGLPDQYQPATLDLESMFLRIGGRTLHFPPCFAEYFKGEYKLEITSAQRSIAIQVSHLDNIDTYNLRFNLATLWPDFAIVEMKPDGMSSKTNERCVREIRGLFPPSESELLNTDSV